MLILAIFLLNICPCSAWAAAATKSRGVKIYPIFAVSQWRQRVSKLRSKGLSDYHSNETEVEAARRGAVG
jgi:hypothetical protein